ncbi:hypothetical protein K488DRAFT_65765, partial [Vararia minispora EC-137]
GIVTQAARTLIRDIVALGVAQGSVMPTARLILKSVNVEMVGDVDRHSIARIVKEGYIAAMLQAVDEIRSAESWTGSADETGVKGVDQLAHHGYMRVEGSPNRVLRFFGTRPQPGKSSEQQIKALASMLSEFIDNHNSSPLGQEQPITLAELLEKLTGWGSDHAEDQKKFFRLLEEWKHDIDREARGRASLHTMAAEAPAELVEHIALSLQMTIERVGGMARWEALLDEERNTLLSTVERELCIRMGQKVVDAMTAEERTHIDLLVWAGCAMHKEQNSVKGGAAAMKAFWASLQDSSGPVLLPNRDNAATVAASQSTSGVPTKQSAAATRAEGVSDSGGVKLTTLAGLIFNHHDDKKGQQRNFRIFFEHALGYSVSFPHTSNNRFGTHCQAASLLLLHLPLFLQFLELIRDKKDKMAFNNMENNIYHGLTDIPTLTELAVLALYAQSVSHPYTRVVRGSGRENALLLGAFHHDVVAHCQAIIDNPDLLLALDVRT